MYGVNSSNERAFNTLSIRILTVKITWLEKGFLQV